MLITDKIYSLYSTIQSTAMNTHNTEKPERTNQAHHTNISEKIAGSYDENSKDGYPVYPAGDDIYVKGKKVENMDPEDLSHAKRPTEGDISGENNEKDFDEDHSGDDLDVPGSELDDDLELVGSEDEENNYYSLGGDDHDDLDEDQGQ